jgi:tetratricopeptide (TPR) repeat protein
MDARIGQVIAGRYRIESVVGAGGVGTVYRAIQEPLERPVALKMLRPEWSSRPSVRQRFLREARSVASLSHPAIAMVHDFGTADDGSLFLVLEFVDGVPLSTLLDDRDVSWALIRLLFDIVLAGLAHAHARGVVHRDIKPGNILVTADSDGTPLVKIVDFGIAVSASAPEDNETAPGMVVGTPLFMAPEQARGDRYLTPAADIYTVGLMLFWAVTGRHAFDFPTAAAIMEAQVSATPPEPVARPGLIVPDGVAEILRDALAKNPLERIASANAFRARLRAVVGGSESDLHEPESHASRRTGEPAPQPGRASRPPTLMEPAAPLLAGARGPTLMEAGPRTLHEASDLAPSRDAHDADVAEAAAPALRSVHGLIGREEERRTMLGAALGAIENDRGLILSIEGAAGLGKSALSAWLRDQLVAHGELKVGAGYFHRDTERSLRGVREAFEGLFDTRGLDTARVAALTQQTLQALEIVDPSDHRLFVSFLRPSLDEPEEGGRIEAYSELIFRILEAMSSTQPVLLVIDDLHYAGPETATLLEYLAVEFTHRPCRAVIVLTVQPEDIEYAELEQALLYLKTYEGRSVVRHELGLLSDDDARNLLSTMLSTTTELADELVARAGGNPLYLVQLVRYLVDERLLERAASGWRARADVDVQNLLPPTLAGILELRIAQVENDPKTGTRLRELLDRCAILGRSFRFSMLTHLLKAESRFDLLQRVDGDIDVLRDNDLLRMTEMRNDDVFSFTSNLIRDVIVVRQKGRRQTRRLHSLAAEAKVAVLGKDSDRIAAELVEHYAAAHERPRELQAARTAAEVAQRNHRPHDAVHFLERALSLLDDEALADADSRALRRSIRLRIAPLSVGFGNYAVAQEHYRSIAEDVEAPLEERVPAVYGQASVAWVQGALDTALALYERGIALAGELDESSLLSKGLLGLASIESHRGNNDRSEELAGRALIYARSGSDPREVAEVFWFMGDLARGRGDFTEAEGMFRQAMARFEQHDQPLGIAKCHAKLAVISRQRNDLDNAVEHYRTALKIYRQHGGRRGVAHQLNGLGDIARFRGDYPLATEHYRRAVDIFQSLRLPFDTALALTNLSLVARDSGNLVESEDALRRALKVAERVGFAYLVLGIKLNLAHVLTLAERLDEANVNLAEALALADETELVDPDYARPLEEIARLKAEAGQTTEADALMERARAMWTELGRESVAEHGRPRGG